jgi:hypothetical protein
MPGLVSTNDLSRGNVLCLLIARGVLSYACTLLQAFGTVVLVRISLVETGPHPCVLGQAVGGWAARLVVCLADVWGDVLSQWLKEGCGMLSGVDADRKDVGALL